MLPFAEFVGWHEAGMASHHETTLHNNSLIHITGNSFEPDRLWFLMRKIWSHWRSTQLGLPWASLISCPCFSFEGRHLINILAQKKKERGGENKEKENIPFAHTVAGSWGSQLAKRGSYGHLTEPSIVPAADKSQLLDVVERRKQLLLNP